MLSVLLLVLKIIGITILVLLGILLLLLLIILFVPVRYRLKVEHGDGFALDGHVSWLLHFLHGSISQTGRDRKIWVRIFGIKVYDSLHSGKAEKARPKKKSRIKPVRPEKQEETELTESDAMETESAKTGMKYTGNLKRPKDKFFSRIVNKVKELIKKNRGFFTGIADKVRNLVQSILGLRERIGRIIDFLNDDINRTGFRFTYDSIKKILKHVGPKKLKSTLVFGTGDPCSTGQILGVLCILYCFYGGDVQITPDFENKVFKGSHYAKGRIRAWTILVIIIRLLVDKRFKKLRMNYQLLKEAL